jgi:hypothetical protein
VVGQRIEEIARAAGAGDLLIDEDLVDRRAVQIPICQRAGFVEAKRHVQSIVHVPLAEIDLRVAVDIDVLHDPPVERVVLVLDPLRDHVGDGLEGHRREAVAVVPRVLDVVAGGDLRLADAVPLAVVQIIVRAVGEELVVVAGRVAGERAIAVVVVGVVLVERAAAAIGPGKLPAEIVAVAGRLGRVRDIGESSLRRKDSPRTYSASSWRSTAK